MKIRKITALTAALAITCTTFQVTAADNEERQNRKRDRISRNADTTSDREVNEQGFNDMERAERLMGSPVQFSDGGNAGRIQDVVIDLESGKALYVILARGDENLDDTETTRAERRRERARAQRESNAETRRNRTANTFSREGYAVPASLFKATTGKILRIDTDREELTSAPRISGSEMQRVDNIPFATRTYKHFGTKAWWTESDSGNFANTHSITHLRECQLQNSQNQDLGRIEDVVLDLPASRVLFVVVEPDSSLDMGNKLFALPPNAITKGNGENTLISGITREKITEGPTFARTDWPGLADYNFARRVYDHYGKKPYFKEGQYSPTSEESDTPRRRNRNRD